MSTKAAFQASARFGLGPRGDELRDIGSDPKGWLVDQLYAPQIPSVVRERHGGAGHVGDMVQAIRQGDVEQAKQARRALREVYVEETGARFGVQARSTQPCVERMLMFWSNHFSVSVQKPILGGLVNAYEVEAIRPHLDGRLEDMLLAVAQHPAMLLYLDNAQSFGPDSRVGRRRGKGLNENLAREILELHTLGVDGGYSQDDVIELAKILTGWSLDRKGREIKIRYRFQPAVHEPGDKTLLGQRFAEAGEQEGIEALRMLARHPATAEHIASKLARHYIADDPPARAVERLRTSFLESGGHLPTVMRTLLELDEAWSPLAKLKNPYEFALSAVRLIGIEPSPQQVLAGLEALNFRTFSAPSPAGFADTAEAWASPDAVMKRIEWAQGISQRLPTRSEPLTLAERGIGPVMSPGTKQTIARAASARDGVALLLASPEFQRR